MPEEGSYNKFKDFKKLSRTAAKDTEQDISLTKIYCITISMQKSVQFINSLLRYSRLRISLRLCMCTFFIMPTQKSLKHYSAFLNLYQDAKKSVYCICSFLKCSQFQRPKIKLNTPIFSYAYPEIF